MIIQKNSVIDGKHDKPILIDTTYLEHGNDKPILIFCHGYKGFKDWGAWNLMAYRFAKAGCFFVKFNFSHNGGTIENHIDFPDLEAFGNNNYSKELDDLESVIDWVTNNDDIKKIGNLNSMSLIGHSRGGGIVLIKANEDFRINKVITLAGVSDFGKRTATIGDFESWKKDGVKYVLNGRTKQQMPHFYQFYEDFIANEERLNIKRAISNLKLSCLIIHGDHDTSVSINEAYALHQSNQNSKLEIIEGANHVFGASHPWNSDKISKHLKEATDMIISFVKNI